MSQLQQLWDQFLQKWPVEKVKMMTLQEYVSTEDKTTFTYWVETQTKPLANINGSPSPKFGIYKRKSEPKEQSGMIHGNEYSWRDRFGATEQEAFKAVRAEIVTIIQAAKQGDLVAIDNAKLAPVYKWKIAFLYQNQQVPTIVNIFAKDKLAELSSLSSKSSYPEFYKQLTQQYNQDEFENIAEYGRVCWSQLDDETLDNNDSSTPNSKSSSLPTESMTMPLNQILYGPPGTGKTYHTIEAAVKAAEPEYYASLNIDEKTGVTQEQRTQLQEKYRELADAKRIRFVTFHQSYGYEEFVEGLKAHTLDGDIHYKVESGVFKSICLAASQTTVKASEQIKEGDKFASFTVEQVTSELIVFCKRNNNSLPISRAVIDEFHAAYASGLFDLNDEPKNWLPNFKNRLEPYLITGFDSLYRAMLPELSARLNDAVISGGNYVLVIDEINRGNISKIFGELITLIEPSKRQGNDEALELVLPYSGKPFSVPSNLHIIGTMNTADRSLAMMDTALRRRFDFVEMMPKPELLSGVSVNGIGLQKLLTVLNQRIEVLYDREHTLGHAFFMPVKTWIEQDKEEQAFTELQSIFQNKIIPLLEEYFFEDWDKIRLVLADNQKPDSLQFVTEKQLGQKALNVLFGSEHGLEQFGEAQKQYSLRSKEEEVWSNALAYKGIYAPNEAKVSERQNADIPEPEAAGT